LPPRLTPSGGGGASSSAAAPAASWSLVGQLSGRACPRPWGEVRGTNACDVAATAPSCCGLATSAVTPRRLACRHRARRRPRHPLRMPPCRHGRSRPECLAGARAGTVGVTLSTRNQKSKRPPLESKVRERRCGSPQIGESPLPLPRGLRGYLRHEHWHLRGA
jgi:hypothetical protein